MRVGGTYGAVFAYVADGRNGVRVLQLIAPNENPYATGFSPPPMPRLIATYKTDGPALTLSKGMDRDRAVDESGNQIAVWGRLGSRPFNRAEMEELFLRNGQLYTVAAAPPGKPARFERPFEPDSDYGVFVGPPVQPLAPLPERLLPGRQ